MVRMPHFAALALGLLAAGGPVPAAPPDRAAQEQAANDYARPLAAVIDTVHQGHVKSAPQHQLVAWAVRGLYAAAKEPVPAELAERLARRELRSREQLA